MRVVMSLLIMLSMLTACNTFRAMKGDSTKERMSQGMKKDAKVTGDTIKRGAHEVGRALGSAFKHGGEKLEKASK